MKTWRTATGRLQCGYDYEHVIKRGQAYLEIQIGQTKKIRCHCCATRAEQAIADAQSESNPADQENHR